ncbi:MAG: hypothetical protein AABY22_31790 [Nanoarchaeota archaeon]
MEKETICKYCKRTEAEIRAESRRTGKRVICFDRGTPEGFHKFIYREKQEARHSSQP